MHSLAPAKQLKDVLLWIHLPTGKDTGDWILEELEKMYNLKPDVDVHYTDGCSAKTHLSPQDMARLYNMWDMMLFLSGGEGFGIPVWEGMCSALPFVYTDYSAHAELLGQAHAGIAVTGVLQPEPRSCVLRMVASVEQSVQAVRKLYYDSKLRRCFGRNGRAFVTHYGVDCIASKWDNIFRQTLNGSPSVLDDSSID